LFAWRLVSYGYTNGDCREAQTGMDHEMDEGIGPKRIIALLFIALLLVGLGAFLLKGL